MKMKAMNTCCEYAIEQMFYLNVNINSNINIKFQIFHRQVLSNLFTNNK